MPVLHNPDWSREFILETDASQFGVGAVLFQEVGGEKRYVDFAAKAFNKAQQNYGAAKRELLAGLFAMARWRPWLLYRRFTWGMDSKVMTFINLSTNQMVLDWINLFMEFDFVTKFKKGVLNVLPHELSHCYDLLELDFGRGEKLGDKGVGLLGKAVLVARGVGTGFDQGLKKFLQEKLDRSAPDSAEGRRELVRRTHQESHMGEAILFKMLWEDGFWWEGMWKECKLVAMGCRDCMKFNVGRRGFHPMGTISADRPWDHIIIDLIGQLKASERGFVFILIIVDVLTCYVVLKPLRTKGAKEIAYALVKVFANYGVPKVLQLDNEQTFLSKVVEELRFIAGFQKRNIMKYNPRQNGLVEWFVAETKRVLFKWLKGDVSGWEGYVPAVQMSLNDHILSHHNSRPFSLMFGRRLNGFEAYRDGEFSDVMTEEQRAELLKEVRNWGEDVWSIILEKGKEVGEAHANWGNARERSKTWVEGFKEGDLVLKKILNRRSKMGEHWEGPFEVLGRDGEQGGYRLKEMDGRFLNFLVPADQLRRVEQVMEEEEVSWEVDKILDHSGEEGQRFYKVKWKGRYQPSWEPAEMFDTTGCIVDYWDKLKRAGGGKGGGKGKGRASSSSSSSSGGRGR